jgi:hypothetical protein
LCVLAYGPGGVAFALVVTAVCLRSFFAGRLSFLHLGFRCESLELGLQRGSSSSCFLYSLACVCRKGFYIAVVYSLPLALAFTALLPRALRSLGGFVIKSLQCGVCCLKLLDNRLGGVFAGFFANSGARLPKSVGTELLSLRGMTRKSHHKARVTSNRKEDGESRALGTQRRDGERQQFQQSSR